MEYDRPRWVETISPSTLETSEKDGRTTLETSVISNLCVEPYFDVYFP